MYGPLRTVHQFFYDDFGGDAELINEVIFAQAIKDAAIHRWLFYVGVERYQT